jgi:hypothetical protein
MAGPHDRADGSVWVSSDVNTRSGWFDKIFGVNDPATYAAQEARVVTEAALALAGHNLDPFTCELIDKMGRGELVGDQAIEAILSRFPIVPSQAAEYEPPRPKS